MDGLLAKSQLFIKRHGSTILTVAGGVGVIATTVMAVKATPKAMELLEKAKDEKGEDLTNIEKIKIAGPSYIPTCLMGVSTVACIFGANILNKRQQAALISAYTMLDTSYKEYKRKLIELYGEETHEEIVNAIAIEKANEVGIRSSMFIDTNCLTDSEACGEPVLFYEEWSHRYFETTIEQVITAEYHLNRNFVLRGFTFLNEFYDFLGIEPNDYGSVLGWSVEDEFYWIEFNHRKTVLDDGSDCFIIETPWGPSTDVQGYYGW